jgi:type IV pilus assembly protein PilB
VTSATDAGLPTTPVAEQALRRRLGATLVAQGALTEAELRRVLAAQHDDGDGTGRRRRLGRILLDEGLVTEHQLAAALGELLGREVVDATSVPVDPAWAERVPRGIALRAQALPLGPGPDGLRVAVADPTDVVALDDVRRLTGEQRLDVVVTTPTQLHELIDRVWRLAPGADIEGLAVAEPAPSEEEEVADAPTVRMVDAILAEAVRVGASDVHVEQQRDAVRIRLRVDGVLRELVALPRGVGRSLTARLKVVAGMDIAERRVPQDGRIRLSVEGALVDARVSSLPAIHGEKVVVRLLPAAATVQRLADLGLADDQRTALVRALEAPQGLVLITGPTGSGKTSTLYAAINETLTPERNIVTLEDPVEIELPGITQVPIDDRAGMTFARGLRALLRQDPDVVLVGEVRDVETAELALRAALTGHLVLTTLHTNDAVAALPRLVDMGVPPYLVASALSLVVGQRLVRTPCPRCRVPYQPEPEVLAALDLTSDDLAAAGAQPTRGAGCATCGHTGYAGRHGLFEVLEVGTALRRQILATPSEAELADAARTQGFHTLREQGLALACAGGTTFEEVLRVTRVGL